MASHTQIKRRGRLGLTLGIIVAALLFAAVAYADDISNNLDTTIDADAEVMPLNVGGRWDDQLYVDRRTAMARTAAT